MNIEQIIQPAPQAYLSAVKAAVQNMHVALPGIVNSYDIKTQTVTVRPTIMGVLQGERKEIPLLLDVPVYFPGGSNCAITYAVNPGDECLVVFADSSIDGWFLRGDVQEAFTNRKHDLSDGFALVGFRSLPKAIDYQENHPFAVHTKQGNDWTTQIMVAQTQNGFEVRAEGAVFIGDILD